MKKCRAAESMPAEAKDLAKQLLDKWKKALKGDGNNAPPKKANGTGQAGEVKKPQVRLISISCPRVLIDWKNGSLRPRQPLAVWG